MRETQTDSKASQDYVYLWCFILAVTDEPGGTCRVKPLATNDNPATENAESLLLPSGVVGNYDTLAYSIECKVFVKVKTEYVKRMRHLYEYFEDDQRKIIKDYCK